MLEFLGATPVADAQLERMLCDVDRLLEAQNRRTRRESQVPCPA